MVDESRLRQSMGEWGQWLSKKKAQLSARAPLSPLPAQAALGLIGVRRSGKTSAAVEFSRSFGDGALYCNFEDPLFMENSDYEVLDQIVSLYIEEHKKMPGVFVLDEIQNIYGWERWVRKAVDLARFRVVVTGSSSKLLSSELSTAIAGRCIEKKIWPLSYLEFLSFLKIEVQHSDEHLGYLRDFMRWGAFPEVVLTPDLEVKKVLLQQYYNDILLKDVVQRNEIRTKRFLDQIVIYSFTNVSCLTSATAIKKAYEIPVDTVSDYLGFLEEAFLLFRVQRYHPNLKVQSRDSKKIYSIDTGLRNAYSVSPNEDRGKLAENVVFLQLKRLGHEIYYYKGEGEVDFLVTEQAVPRQAIQVCYSSMESPETFAREVGSLVECLKAVGLEEGLILTDRRHETLTVSGKKIRILPLYVWLLGK